MAMRSQVYEWDAGRNGGGTLSYGQKYSIFIGGVGNNITKPAETTATQFCVIEDCAVSQTNYGTQSSKSPYIGTAGSLGPRA